MYEGGSLVSHLAFQDAAVFRLLLFPVGPQTDRDFFRQEVGFLDDIPLNPSPSFCWCVLEAVTRQGLLAYSRLGT